MPGGFLEAVAMVANSRQPRKSAFGRIEGEKAERGGEISEAMLFALAGSGFSVPEIATAVSICLAIVATNGCIENPTTQHRLEVQQKIVEAVDLAIRSIRRREGQP